MKWIVAGGTTALGSQYNGLDAIQRSNGIDLNDIVLIHDGVRPLINETTITDCIESVKTYGSAVTTVPAIETIIQTDEADMIKCTFPRSECRLARAPQAFGLGKILEMHHRAIRENKHDFVDSTSMMLYFGEKIHTIEGPVENIKVTNPSDFYICRALMDAKENSQIYGL